MANEEVISLKKINGRMFIDLIVESTTTIVHLLPLPDGSASPAQPCGLRVGDTIVAFGGVKSGDGSYREVLPRYAPLWEEMVAKYELKIPSDLMELMGQSLEFVDGGHSSRRPVRPLPRPRRSLVAQIVSRLQTTGRVGCRPSRPASARCATPSSCPPSPSGKPALPTAWSVSSRGSSASQPPNTV